MTTASSTASARSVARENTAAHADVRATLWLVGVLALCVLAYYFVGIDQGAVSVFGDDMHVHEFVHDARHFAGFPCH